MLAEAYALIIIGGYNYPSSTVYFHDKQACELALFKVPSRRDKDAYTAWCAPTSTKMEPTIVYVDLKK